MLIILHCIANIIYELYKKHVKKKTSAWSNFSITKSDEYIAPFAERDAKNDIRFDPPLYKQRYQKVLQVLSDAKFNGKFHKLVDFGCAEFNLFIFLKNTIKIQDVLLVDVDEPLLREYYLKLAPLNGDYLGKRPHPLSVKVFVGSIADPDLNLANTDVVTAVELIEHLYPDVLEAVPYNVFSIVQPKLVVVTTPNSDFNVLFPKLKCCKFRHHDHKFEWDQEQFQSWATNITTRFPDYTVEFSGVGLGPRGSDNVGCCSQVAVFTRKDLICDNYVKAVKACSCTNSTCKLPEGECMSRSSFGICTYRSRSKTAETGSEAYKMLAQFDYPYEIDERTFEEKIVDELKYRIHYLGDSYGRFFDEEAKRSEIPVAELIHIPLLRNTNISVAEISDLLLQSGYQIKECCIKGAEQAQTCVVHEPEMETSDSFNEDDASGYESDACKPPIDDSELSDWDEPPKAEPETLGETLKHELHLEINDVNKRALFDSGYQKSPSVPDESPQSSLIASDEKQEPKPAEKPNRLSNFLSVFDDFDQVNESVRKDKMKFFIASNIPHKEMMQKICQEIANKNPVAGPSRDFKRPRPKKSSAPSSDSEESAEEAKSITTCIVENTLNKIQIPNEQHADLIQDLLPDEVPEPVPVEEVLEPVAVVENGDLANNNRDREGNNYPEVQDIPVDELVDNIVANNVNIDNNNEAMPVIVEDIQIVQEEGNEEVEQVPPQLESEFPWSSQEALCGENSHVDLLDDFDMDPSVPNALIFPPGYVIVAGPANDAAGSDDGNFPHWLLGIFQESQTLVGEDELDEAHFYCQGDGLGVHPSTVGLDDDDDEDDEGNESGSEGSSSSGSVDFVSAETANSGQEQEAAPAPEDRVNLVVSGQAIAVEEEDEESEEVFQNAE